MSVVALRLTPRLATSAFYLAGGVGQGSWAASLPAISIRLSLDKGELGLVLLGFAVGAIFAMTNIARFIPRFGTARLCRVSGVSFGMALLAVPHCGNVFVLALVVILAGAAFGTLDIVMNTEASFLERRIGRHIMSSFHAVFSVGGLMGAAICGQILRSGGNVVLCLGAAGIVVMALSALAAARSASPADQASGPSQPAQPSSRLTTQQRRRLLLIGGVNFLALFAEGAIMDWTTIYLVSTVGTSESLAAFGFAIFAGMMAAGRAMGDIATRWLGPVRVMRWGAAAVAISLATVLLMSHVGVIFVALAFCGLGIANIVPAIFSTAGRIGGTAAGAAISRVSTMGYSGLLAGPPFIGFLAQATSLTISLSVVAMAAVVIAMSASLMKTEPSGPGGPGQPHTPQSS